MESSSNSVFNFREAGRFWEPRRLWYNGALFLVVLLWVAYTWPHFRPALTLVALGKMTVLALLANVCYTAAYLVELIMQAALPLSFWRRVRWTFWIAGMLLALLAANYWIADEIYPDVSGRQGAAMLGAGQIVRGDVGATSNINFPAPLAVLGFLGASIGLFVALAAILIFCFARRLRFARNAAAALGAMVVIYSALLLGLSAASHDMS